MKKDTPQPQEQVTPWQPMAHPLGIALIGKMLEELGELSAVCSRVLIQGIDESQPVTGKQNREWLEEEIADVLANISLVTTYYGLNAAQIEERADFKVERLTKWHELIK